MARAPRAPRAPDAPGASSGASSALQATFADPAPPRKKEWSPIDRMLANKRASGSKRSSPTTMMEKLSPRDQTPVYSKPQTRTATVGSQTPAWNVLVTEAVAPERARVQALQAELKALRAHVKERDDAARVAEAAAASHANAREAMASELEVAQQLLAEAREARENEQEAWAEERRSWEEERSRLQLEASSAGSTESRFREDLEHLRAELKRSKDDTMALRKKHGKLQQDMDELARVKEALAKEKDDLLQQLEVEQAEMIARVDALQRKMTERPPEKAYRSFDFAAAAAAQTCGDLISVLS